MGEDITVRESGIYLLNRVEVTLKDDSRAEGILQNITAETITVEGREIMLSDVADIRLAGELTDYDVMRDTGMIGNFTFAPEACRDAAELELMRYGDFACTVSCHLKLASGKICADDIRLVSHTHKICAEKLSRTAAIYSFFDGTFLVGRLQQDGTGMLEQSGSGQVPVDFAGVKEIFPLPETNDSLHVTMKDGSCREGVVSAVTDTMFVLIGEGVAMIPFADMQEIRYCGKVVRVREPGSRGKTDTWKIAVGSRDAEDGFWCRVPEHSGAAQIGVGDQVSFVPGITDCEWIAKDVRLRQERKNRRKRGIQEGESFYFSRMHSGRTALSGTAMSHRIMRRWRMPDCRAEISCFHRSRLTLDSNRAISTWFPTPAPKNLVRWCRKRSV